MKTYLIVFYTAIGNFGGYNVGNVACETENVFFTSNELHNLIKDRNPNFTNVVITNILFISKEQYEYWTNV